ncbi:unnamed protein product [Chrysoparadoxa australica]
MEVIEILSSDEDQEVVLVEGDGEESDSDCAILPCPRRSKKASSSSSPMASESNSDDDGLADPDPELQQTSSPPAAGLDDSFEALLRTAGVVHHDGEESPQDDKCADAAAAGILHYDGEESLQDDMCADAIAVAVAAGEKAATEHVQSSKAWDALSDLSDDSGADADGSGNAILSQISMPGMEDLGIFSQQSVFEAEEEEPPQNSSQHHESNAATDAVGTSKAKKAKAVQGEQAVRREAAARKREAKKKEQDERARKRQEDKAEKLRAKEQAKAAKKLEKEMQRGHAGKFYSQEIGCVMEASLHSRCPIAVQWTSGAQGTKENFSVFKDEIGCCVDGAVWWTRRDYAKGGAAATGKDVLKLGLLAVVVDGEEFMELLRVQGDEGSGAYPLLGQHVDQVRRSMPGHDRLMFILNGAKAAVESQVVDCYISAAAAAPGSPAVTTQNLEDAISWLFVFKEVECWSVDTEQEVGQYLWSATR